MQGSHRYRYRKQVRHHLWLWDRVKWHRVKWGLTTNEKHVPLGGDEDEINYDNCLWLHNFVDIKTI